MCMCMAMCMCMCMKIHIQINVLGEELKVIHRVRVRGEGEG